MKIKIFLFAILFFTCKIALCQPTGFTMPAKGLCAHRGGMDTRPENTIPAFKNAIEAGVQMIEFDIQFSKDSVLVIMHDDAVGRTTNGSGKVSDLTLAELKKLDAGIKKGEAYKGTRIPTLEETLAVMPYNIWLNCHLKGDAALGKAVAIAVKKSGRQHQCLLACSELAAEAARLVVPEIIICNADNKYRKETEKYVQATISGKATFIQLLAAVGTAEERKPFIEQLKNNKVHINYFYAAGANTAKAIWDEGIDFILVNDLPTFLPQMKNYGIEPVKPDFKKPVIKTPAK